MNKPEHLIIHHTASKVKTNQFLAVNNYHKSLDFPKSSIGFYVGYHWFIERNGVKIRARADSDVGAHTLGGYNTKSIGVCMAGNFNSEVPSDAQIATLRGLIEEYGLPVLLHREADTRLTCPGRYVDKSLYTQEKIVDNVDKEKAKGIEEQLSIIIKLLNIIINLIKK